VAKFLDAERLWDHLDVIDYDSYWHEQSESHQKRQQRAQDLLEEFTQLMSPSSAVKPRHGANDADLADIRDLQHQFERELRLVIGEFEDDDNRPCSVDDNATSEVLTEDEMVNQVMEEIRKLSEINMDTSHSVQTAKVHSVNGKLNRSHFVETQLEVNVPYDGSIEEADAILECGIKRIHSVLLIDLIDLNSLHEIDEGESVAEVVRMENVDILSVYDELASFITNEMQQLQDDCEQLILTPLDQFQTPYGVPVSLVEGLSSLECNKLRQELQQQQLRYERDLEESSANILELENTLEEYRGIMKDHWIDIDMGGDESDASFAEYLIDGDDDHTNIDDDDDSNAHDDDDHTNIDDDDDDEDHDHEFY
jgi:hypothetical protein